MKIQDSKLKAMTRHTIIIVNDIVSIILTLLPLIFALFLLLYTTRLQSFRWKLVKKWALTVLICHPPINQKLSSGGYVENSNVWELVSAFQMQTWVETTTIKAKCGRREASQSKINTLLVVGKHPSALIHSSPCFVPIFFMFVTLT